MSEMTNNPAVNEEEVLDLTEQARVRREKLDQLKAEGKNP